MMVLSIVLNSSPSLAQLPELPPAPPAPPASPPHVPPTPRVSPTPTQPIPSAPTPNAASRAETTFIRPLTVCPQDFDTLSTLLIRDIPGYTNRVLQSSIADIPTGYRPSYIITASQPERMPLEIRDRIYTTSPAKDQSLHQLFFTTLERQYAGLETNSISHFHWLFLTPGEAGWHMVFMFSAIGADDKAQLPPRDSSQGSIGQAVQRWLRDCRADAIFPE